MTQPRVAGGVPAGGQFATPGRSESAVALAPAPRGTLTIEGAVPPADEAFVERLHDLNLGDAHLTVLSDGGRLVARLQTAVSGYRLSRYEEGFYRLVADGAGGYDDVLVSVDADTDQMAQGLRDARSKAIDAIALADAKQMMAEGDWAPSLYRAPVDLRTSSDSDVTELGFALPGDHIKVRTFVDDVDDQGAAAGQLFAHSSTRDAWASDLTERQSRNRLNKVLDEVHPGSRELAERYVRRFLAVAGGQAHAARAADAQAIERNGYDA